MRDVMISMWTDAPQLEFANLRFVLSAVEQLPFGGEGISHSQRNNGYGVDSVDKRSLRATATAISEAKTGLLASSGEDWRWKGDELRQLPQILGGGCQEALVFRSARSPQAQLTEPEDALQVSKQHLDLLSLPA
jgi:hypothetical protein